MRRLRACQEVRRGAVWLQERKGKNKYTFAIFKRELPLHLMLLPGLILVAVFSYTPMAGLVIAFQKFIPSKGMFGDQQWVGLGNFSYVFSLPGFNQALKIRSLSPSGNHTGPGGADCFCPDVK